MFCFVIIASDLIMRYCSAVGDNLSCRVRLPSACVRPLRYLYSNYFCYFQICMSPCMFSLAFSCCSTGDTVFYIFKLKAQRPFHRFLFFFSLSSSNFLFLIIFSTVCSLFGNRYKPHFLSC